MVSTSQSISIIVPTFQPLNLHLKFNMSNLAAIIPAAKAPIEIHSVEKYTPGPGEILVKNTSIAYNPLEWKIARLAFFPLPYPAILGFSFGGIVEATGENVDSVKIGDNVVVSRKSSDYDNKFGAYQQYVIASADAAFKLPKGVNVDIASSAFTNFLAVVAALSITAGLDKPSIDGPVPAKNKKILIYGGSSSVGSLAIQFAAQAGYTVVTTSSPRNFASVSKLGAEEVVDHTLSEQDIISAFTSKGPYDFFFDSISLPQTAKIVASVVSAQGGGEFITVMPATKEETLPENTKRIYNTFPFLVLEYKEHEALKRWVAEYFPAAIAQGKIVPIKTEKVKGGLYGVSDALDRLQHGVSGVKLLGNPWET
jgi:NADPH:quinone reductase-like Zn-dependent oxidoreductase